MHFVKLLMGCRKGKLRFWLATSERYLLCESLQKMAKKLLVLTFTYFTEF